MRLRQARKIRKNWKTEFTRTQAVHHYNRYGCHAKTIAFEGQSAVMDGLLQAIQGSAKRPPVEKWRQGPALTRVRLMRAFRRLPREEQIDWWVDSEVMKGWSSGKDSSWNGVLSNAVVGVALDEIYAISEST